MLIAVVPVTDDEFALGAVVTGPRDSATGSSPRLVLVPRRSTSLQGTMEKGLTIPSTERTCRLQYATYVTVRKRSTAGDGLRNISTPNAHHFTATETRTG